MMISKPRWTRKQEWMLHDLIEHGHSYSECAKRIGRSRAAILNKSKKMRVAVTMVKTTLSQHETAQLLGIGRETVARWIKFGDLRARNARTINRPLWRVSWENLTAFLERRDRWMAWKPEKITDLALREWAQEIRQDTGEWLTIVQVAKHHHCSRWTVSSWVRENRMPAVRYYQWWIHSASLVDFQPPANQLYGHSQKIMSVITTTPQSTAALATQIDACMSATYHTLCRLVKSGHVRQHGTRIATWSLYDTAIDL